MKLGIATIYQELDLVEGLTVAENIFLGHELSTGGISQRRSARGGHASPADPARPRGDLTQPRGR